MSRPSNHRSSSSSNSSKIARSNSILRVSSPGSSFLNPSSPSAPVRRCSFDPPVPVTLVSESELKAPEPTSLIDRRRKNSAGAATLPRMTFNDLPPRVSTSPDLEELVTPEIIGNSAEMDLINSTITKTPGGSLKRGLLNKQYFSSKIRKPTPYPQEERREWLEGEDVDQESENEEEEEKDEEQQNSKEVL